MVDSIEGFLAQQRGEQRRLLAALHDWLLTFELTPKVRYRIPFYYQRSWVCYLNPVAQEGVELAFLRGYALSNEQGLLDARGRKQVAGVIFYRTADVPPDLLREVVYEALLLDEHATRR